MKYSTKTGTLTQLATGALVTGLKTAHQVARALKQGTLLEAAVADFKDLAGQILTVRLPQSSSIKRIVIAGGADTEQSEAQFRKMTSAAVATLKSLPTPNAIWALTTTKVTGRDSHWKAANALFALSTGI